jgi:hypothetical protein
VVSDNLVLYNDKGLYITQLSKPIVDETTKLTEGDISSVFYGKIAKKLFVYQNKKGVLVFDWDGVAKPTKSQTQSINYWPPVLFTEDSNGNVYAAEAYKIHKYSPIYSKWSTLETGYPDPTYDGSVISLVTIDDKPVVGLNFMRGQSSWLINFEKNSLDPISIEDRRSGTIPNVTTRSGRNFELDGNCLCEIELNDANITILTRYAESDSNYLHNLVISDSTIIGFAEDNSYQLFDTNSKLGVVAPFATGTLPYITDPNYSIRHLFSTSIKNEFIIVTYDNIYRVRLAS